MSDTAASSLSRTESADAKCILMVDDNPADSRLVDEALSMCGLKANLHMVDNAIAAFKYLAKQPPYAGAPTPDLILLDLSMPVVQGNKVLDIIKRNPDWRDIPVFILSSSMQRGDIETCYSMGADLYIVKPVFFDHYLRLVKAIGAYLTDKKPIGQTSAIHVMTPKGN
jgi:CheY-like chemotaxis protein